MALENKVAYETSDPGVKKTMTREENNKDNLNKEKSMKPEEKNAMKFQINEKISDFQNKFNSDNGKNENGQITWKDGGNEYTYQVTTTEKGPSIYLSIKDKNGTRTDRDISKYKDSNGKDYYNMKIYTFLNDGAFPNKTISGSTLDNTQRDTSTPEVGLNTIQEALTQFEKAFNIKKEIDNKQQQNNKKIANNIERDKEVADMGSKIDEAYA